MADLSSRTVTVTGIAAATVRPDRATLTLGVQARAASAGEALAVAAQRASAVIAALRSAGVGDADIQTSGISLWSERPDRGARTVYVAGHTLTASTGADDAGRLIDLAAPAGGDEFTMNGLSLSIADPAAVVAPLRTEALADARAKAEALAAAEGAAVGVVVTIVEGAGMDIPMPRARGEMRAMTMPVEVGTQSLTMRVTATYELT